MFAYCLMLHNVLRLVTVIHIQYNADFFIIFCNILWGFFIINQSKYFLLCSYITISFLITDNDFLQKPRKPIDKVGDNDIMIPRYHYF